MAIRGRFNLEGLYERYAHLGNEITSYSLIQQWERIAQEGLWSLSMPKEQGGCGLGWEASFTAIEGLTSTCHHIELISLLITHMNVLYLILQHGTTEQKTRYLPRLREGTQANIIMVEVANQNIPPFHDVLKRRYFFNEGRQSSVMLEHMEIIIFIIHIYYSNKTNDIVFFIDDRCNDCRAEDIHFKRENILVNRGKSKHALYNLIQVKKLLYGILGASIALPIADHCQSGLHGCQPLSENISTRKIAVAIEDDVKKSWRMLHRLLINKNYPLSH